MLAFICRTTHWPCGVFAYGSATSTKDVAPIPILRSYYQSCAIVSTIVSGYAHAERRARSIAEQESIAVRHVRVTGGAGPGHDVLCLNTFCTGRHERLAALKAVV